jgi:flagellar biosynthesis protein FlhF
MKIKRFLAETMREALASVRDEQGPDAVIISNRRVEGGVELITAVDYDETLIAEALKRPRAAAELARSAEPARVAEPAPAPAPVAAAAPAKATPRPRAVPPPAAKPVPPPAAIAVSKPALAPATAKAAAPEPAVEPTPAPPVARVIHSQNEGLFNMRREVETLRSLLQDQVASLAWSDRLRREPHKAEALRALSALGLAPDIARALAEQVPPGTDPKSVAGIAAAVLCKQLPTVDDGVLTAGGMFAIVGPTGVGKTTTIAKLAARWALRHGPRAVALVSLDHHRIGARDQLLTFARILGVPMHVATDRRELTAVLGRLADRKLVLVDTAGMSPREPRLAELFQTLELPDRPLRTMLALAANSEHGALERIVRSYAAARPESLVLTKLDEAASLGAAFSVAIRHALPLAWLADGQRVPADLAAAPPKRLWLIKHAQRLLSEGGATGEVDESYLAGHFGKVPAHG